MSTHHQLTSETIRTVTQLCKLIDDLEKTEPERAADTLKIFKSTLTAAHKKLAKITPAPKKLKPVRHASFVNWRQAHVPLLEDSSE